jgi:hypothetical protein|tara:strand:- start:380 stop:655 length:276 start_codon:yes stop_codon:yes gene_type:complete
VEIAVKERKMLTITWLKKKPTVSRSIKAKAVLRKRTSKKRDALYSCKLISRDTWLGGPSKLSMGLKLRHIRLITMMRDNAHNNWFKKYAKS